MLEQKIEELTKAIVALTAVLNNCTVTPVGAPVAVEKAEEVATPTSTPKKAPKAKKEPVVTIDLDYVKELAKKAVRVIGRDETKAIIQKYAEKLVDMQESDYPAFVKDLEAAGV